MSQPPVNPVLYFQQFYDHYQAGNLLDPTILPKTAHAPIQARQVVMYVLDPETIGQGKPSPRVMPYVEGEGYPVGVALNNAEVEQAVRVLIHGLVKGARLPPAR